MKKVITTYDAKTTALLESVKKTYDDHCEMLRNTYLKDRITDGSIVISNQVHLAQLELAERLIINDPIRLRLIKSIEHIYAIAMPESIILVDSEDE